MNKWHGIGRLTKDPDCRYSQTGTCVARYVLAIDRRFKREETDYIPCVALGKAGEFAEKYLFKGMKIAVTGRIETGSYVNKNGTKIYTTDIIVEEQDFVESKKNAEPKAEPKEDLQKSEGFMDIPENVEEQLPFL